MFERLRGRGVLLDQRRVLLGDLVHLRQRLVDLFQAGRLFGARRRNVGDDIRDLLDRCENIVQRRPGAVDQFHAFAHLIR